MSFAEVELTRDKFLGGSIEILQPKHGYRSGTDAVLLASAVPANPGQTVLEIGCGSGVAILCLCSRVQGLTATGLEIQAEYAELAECNAISNGIDLEVIAGDVADPPKPLLQRSFDHAVANPPYFRRGRGSHSADCGRAMAKVESVPLKIWVDCLLRRLKPSGWLSMIITADRLPELLDSLSGRAGSIAVKPLHSRPGRKAGRVLVRARKGDRGAFEIASPMVLHDGQSHQAGAGGYSEAAQRILRDGAAMEF